MKTIEELSAKEFLLALIHQQVQPALGCTEIGIVSLAAAKASSLLPGKFKSAIVYTSPYVFRNDSRVGVPRLGRCGMATIAAAGIILKNPLKKLSCLDDLTPETIAEARKLGSPDAKAIDVEVDFNSHPVYVRCVAKDDKNNESDVIIKYSHDNIIQAKLNGKETLDPSEISGESASGYDFDSKVDQLSIHHVYDICKTLTLKELSFLRGGLKMNQIVQEEGYAHPDETAITKVWQKVLSGQDKDSCFKKDHWTTQILSDVCAAVDARMYGCPLPVMTSSSSGDHGLTVSIPQDVYAKKFNVDEIIKLQALAFAHFITWKIKSKVGHLCGMCGSALAAGCGTIGGIGFQRGWSWNKINDLLNMHLVSQGGILCDGAKPSCSFKILASLVCGFLCLTIAEGDGKISHRDGLVHQSVEETINNLGKYSKTTQNSIIMNVVDLLNAMSKLK
ncbi:MAG: serine dehydratase subunit alpha family protein [Mycoplasma sp.]|nr:serine dehydratase subunit alpha family protein [Candidatus Hennigella equi]